MKHTRLLNVLWRLYALWYDGLLKVRPYLALLGRVLDGAEIRSGQRVLDVGSGTGNLYGEYQRSRHGREAWHFLDGAPAMLARIQRKHPSVLPGRLHLVDFNDGPSRDALDGQYDHIFLVNSLYTATDPVAVLRWLREHATPGAQLVATAPWSRPKIGPVIAEHKRLALKDRQSPRLYWLVAVNLPVVLINALIKRLIGAGVFSAPQDAAELEEWFGQAGWNVTEIVTRVYGGQNWLVRAQKPKGD